MEQNGLLIKIKTYLISQKLGSLEIWVIKILRTLPEII